MVGPRLTRDEMDLRQMGKVVVRKTAGRKDSIDEAPRKEFIFGVETWSVDGWAKCGFTRTRASFEVGISVGASAE